MKPPHREYVLPAAPATGSWYRSILQRSSGISMIASTPVVRSRQNDAGSATSPGKRQPIPTMAIGSRREASRCGGMVSSPSAMPRLRAIAVPEKRLPPSSDGLARSSGGADRSGYGEYQQVS